LRPSPKAYLGVGVRASDAVGIAWDHLDVSGGVLLVRQSNWRGRLLTVKSKASVRDLPLLPALVDMLNDYRPRWRPNAFGLLFANAKGQPIPVSTCVGTSCTRSASGWGFHAGHSMHSGMVWAQH
jgi:integrase